MKRTALLAAFAVAMVACGNDSPVPTAGHMAHGGVMVSDLSQASTSQSLSGLREFTARFHDLDAAEAAQYALLVAPPATATDGCISDPTLGGMGYHYTRGNNLGDDAIDLLDPEFLVYAPTNAPAKDGVARRRLAAVEYFLPFTAKWPGPSDPTFTKAPTLHDFASTSGLPDLAFAPVPQFNGWMFHIWLWENNPGGMFENFNTAVPRCG